MDLATAVVVVPARGAGQDRAGVVDRGGRVTVVVADGAGGTTRGAAAADAVMRAALAADPALDPVALLHRLDGDPVGLGLGETTAVVVTIADGALVGASVGDSAAWWIDAAGVDELTAAQARKPLLGAGATPIGFARVVRGPGALVVATDGVAGRVSLAQVAAVALGDEPTAAAARLIDAARLPAGALADDAAVVVVRRRAAPLT